MVSGCGILISSWPCYLGLPRWLSGKEFTCQTGDMRSTPGSERSSGEGNDNPLQYSCLGNQIDRGTWWATVHGGGKRVRYGLATKQQRHAAWKPLCLLSAHTYSSELASSRKPPLICLPGADSSVLFSFHDIYVQLLLISLYFIVLASTVILITVWKILSTLKSYYFIALL